MSNLETAQTGQDDRNEEFRRSSVERPPQGTDREATVVATAGFSEDGQSGAGILLSDPLGGSTGEGEDASLDTSGGEDDDAGGGIDDAGDGKSEEDKVREAELSAAIGVAATGATTALEAAKVAVAALEAAIVAVYDDSTVNLDAALEMNGAALNAVDKGFEDLRRQVEAVDGTIESCSGPYSSLADEFAKPETDGAQAIAPADSSD